MPASRPRLLNGLRERAARLGCRLVLPESSDVRVLTAARLAWEQGLCRPILIGDPDTVRRAAASGPAGVLPPEIEILDPGHDPHLPALEAALGASLERRRLRVPNLSEKVRDPLYYACLLVNSGVADGAVMGARATTTDTLRAALRVIGPAFIDGQGGEEGKPGLVTSCFLMILPDGRALVYADCGVIPDPDAGQLAEIAVQAAATYELLVGGEPRVALLSFSTKGSASHPMLDKVLEAGRLLAARGVPFAFDAELQADAALVPEIGERKAPGSPVAGSSNVLVFPDLNSGNIAYKLTERLAGAVAVGPLLRGLARPIHDLSRGCSVEDILDTLAITALDTSRQSPWRTP